MVAQEDPTHADWLGTLTPEQHPEGTKGADPSDPSPPSDTSADPSEPEMPEPMQEERDISRGEISRERREIQAEALMGQERAVALVSGGVVLGRFIEERRVEESRLILEEAGIPTTPENISALLAGQTTFRVSKQVPLDETLLQPPQDISGGSLGIESLKRMEAGKAPIWIVESDREAENLETIFQGITTQDEQLRDAEAYLMPSDILGAPIKPTPGSITTMEGPFYDPSPESQDFALRMIEMGISRGEMMKEKITDARDYLLPSKEEIDMISIMAGSNLPHSETFTGRMGSQASETAMELTSATASMPEVILGTGTYIIAEPKASVVAVPVVASAMWEGLKEDPVTSATLIAIGIPGMAEIAGRSARLVKAGGGKVKGYYGELPKGSGSRTLTTAEELGITQSKYDFMISSARATPPKPPSTWKIDIDVPSYRIKDPSRGSGIDYEFLSSDLMAIQGASKELIIPFKGIKAPQIRTDIPAPPPSTRKGPPVYEREKLITPVDEALPPDLALRDALSRKGARFQEEGLMAEVVEEITPGYQRQRIPEQLSRKSTALQEIELGIQESGEYIGFLETIQGKKSSSKRMKLGTTEPEPLGDIIGFRITEETLRSLTHGEAERMASIVMSKDPLKGKKIKKTSTKLEDFGVDLGDPGRFYLEQTIRPKVVKPGEGYLGELSDVLMGFPEDITLGISGSQIQRLGQIGKGKGKGSGFTYIDQAHKYDRSFYDLRSQRGSRVEALKIARGSQKESRTSAIDRFRESAEDQLGLPIMQTRSRSRELSGLMAVELLDMGMDLDISDISQYRIGEDVSEDLMMNLRVDLGMDFVQIMDQADISSYIVPEKIPEKGMISRKRPDRPPVIDIFQDEPIRFTRPSPDPVIRIHMGETPWLPPPIIPGGPPRKPPPIIPVGFGRGDIIEDMGFGSLWKGVNIINPIIDPLEFLKPKKGKGKKEKLPWE